MFDRIFIKFEDFVFVRKKSRAKKPKYDINDSVLIRDVPNLDKYEIDKTLTEAGVQDLIQKVQLALKKRFKSVMPTAFGNHYRFETNTEHMIAENQLLAVTVQNDNNYLIFRIKQKQDLNRQSIVFMQKWCETISRTLLANRKPLYDKYATQINTTEELDEYLFQTRPSVMNKKKEGEDA